MARLFRLFKPRDPALPPGQRLGMAGEKLAARYLKKELGMRVVAQRVLCPRGEIDLVAFDKGDLVFIEVRTRATDDFGPPEKTVDAEKRRAIRHAAQWFARSRRLSHYPIRLDLVAIVWPPDQPPRLRYHRSAFAMQNDRFDRGSPRG